MFNNQRENISEIMNVSNVIQYKHNISKTLTRINTLGQNASKWTLINMSKMP